VRRTQAIIAAALVAVAVNFVGVFLFFRPIAEADSVSWVPPQAVGFSVYVLLSVFVLDWAVRQFGRPVKMGLVIALSQIILVIDLFLRGERGIATAAAGAVLILVTWTAMGYAYGKALPNRQSAVDQAAHGA
jgi:hypothetical protein